MAAPAQPKRLLLIGPYLGPNDHFRFGQVRQALGRRDLGAAGRAAAAWLQEEGWRYSPLRLLQGRAEAKAEREFDQQHGVDTAPSYDVRPEEVVGQSHDGRFWYLASVVEKYRRMLKVLPRLGGRYEDFTFIDLGSGKGRTILLAGEQPFKAVVGVEYSRVYHEIAEENLKKYPLRKAGRRQAVLADAGAYEFPAGNLVVHNYNSLPESVLTQVLENLNRAVRQEPRRIVLVFLNLSQLGLPAGEQPNLAYGEALLARYQFRLQKVYQGYRFYEWVA